MFDYFWNDLHDLEMLLLQVKLKGNSLGTTGIPHDYFQALPLLNYVDLENNGISSLPDFVFSGIGNSLTYLRLYQNQLTIIEKNTLSGLAVLQTLDLQYNSLHTISIGAFNDLIALSDLNLDGNNLEVFREGIFNISATPSSLNIDFSGNSIVCDADLCWTYHAFGTSVSGMCDGTWGRNSDIYYELNAKVCGGHFEIDDGTSSDLSAVVIPGNAETVDLHGNAFIGIPANYFQSQPGLWKIDCNNNGISNIGENAFLGIGSSLTWMDLSYNQLTSIGENQFIGSSLTFLNIRNNYITSIGLNSFKGLNFLQTLDLQDNSIQSVSIGAFNDLLALTDLDLDTNQLQVLPKGIFNVSTTPSSLNLDLSGNSIICDAALCWAYHAFGASILGMCDGKWGHNGEIYYELNGKVCGGHFEIDDGTSSDLSAVVIPGNVETIDLNSNSFGGIPANYFQNQPGLWKIDFSFNSILNIGENAFLGIGSSLTWMDLRHNQVTSIGPNQFKGLFLLNHLDMDDNSIDSISVGAFSDLRAITLLDLSGNNLQTLNEGKTFQLHHTTPLSIAQHARQANLFECLLSSVGISYIIYKCDMLMLGNGWWEYWCK